MGLHNSVGPQERSEIGAAQAYERVRKELKAEFGEEEFRSWFAELRLVGEDEGALLFATPSATARDWLRRNAQHRIEARLCQHVALERALHIVTEAEAAARFGEAAPAPLAAPAAPAPAPAAALANTFASFCVGASNEGAYNTARAISRGEGGAFPLVLLHGAPGVGKTHLLQAIAAESRRLAPARRVRYMMSQLFIEDFQAAIHKKRDCSGFKASVRENDLLLLDDVQRIAGKRATEEEFFDTIAVVTAQGGQVVMSADHGADGLSGFDERLRAHLKSAVECVVGEPDFALRRQILDAKLAQYAATAPGFQISPAVLDMIAARVRGPGRLLDGAIKQLFVEVGMAGREATLELAEAVLKSRFSAAEKRPTVDLIIKTTAKHFALTPQELLSRSRKRAIARPRQIAMFVCTRMTTRSLPDIGNRFGGFDHTTVLYARDRVAELFQSDAQMRQEVEAVENAVRCQLQ
jgi:chromosomal replication initiator protein